MTDVSIFGSGTMGGALTAFLGRAGATVHTIGRGADASQLVGDLVILAVPYESLAPIAAQYGDALSGKVVVDITNPVDFATFTPLELPAGSATEELAALLPDARVVKAFNTNYAAHLESGRVGDLPPTVLVAGDDESAKRVLLELADAAGARGIDAGPLSRARQLEALCFLQMGITFGDAVPSTSGFVLVS